MKKTTPVNKHEGHRTVITETGSIRFVGGDVVDTQKDELYCLDCHEVVPEVNSNPNPSTVIPF